MSKTGTHDDSIVLDSLYFVNCIVKVPTEGTPRRAPFRIQLHRLSGTVPHRSETLAGRLGAESNETVFRSAQFAQVHMNDVEDSLCL